VWQLYCHGGVNMATPLSICTEEEQHAVIRFLWAESLPGAEISG